MLTEAMAKMMKGLAEYANLVGDMVSIGPVYTGSLEAFYKEERLREIFGAGGVDLEKVFANAVLKTDSELIRHPTDAFPEKDLRERLESLEGMWNSINKNACINSLSQELQNILKDNRTAGEERIQNVSFEAIKRQVGEWTKERPIMNELEKNNPGTIMECVDTAIDICQLFYKIANMPEFDLKLKDAVSQHFAPDLDSLKRKAPMSLYFSPEPTKGEPANVEYKGVLERRRVRTPASNGFGHKDYENQFESKSQNSLDVAKMASTSGKEPEEPKVPKHPEKHTPSKSKDFLSR